MIIIHYSLIHFYEYLGFSYRITNQLSHAEYYFKKALGLSVSLQNINDHLQNLLRLAHVYQWQKEFDKSLALFDQVRSIINENKISKMLQASYHQHLGKFYFDQKYYGLALTEFELALNLRLQNKAPQDQIESTELAINTSKKKYFVKWSNELKIRRAIIEDAEKIHYSHMRSINEICGKDYSEAELKVWGGRNYDPNTRVPGIQNQFYLVVESKNKIEGFCQLKVYFENNEKQAHLFGLYLTPETLNKNVGSALMSLIFEYCKLNKVKKINLKSTITALNFYKKHGLIQLGEMSGIERNGVLIRSYNMEKTLDCGHQTRVCEPIDLRQSDWIPINKTGVQNHGKKENYCK